MWDTHRLHCRSACDKSMAEGTDMASQPRLVTRPHCPGILCTARHLKLQVPVTHEPQQNMKQKPHNSTSRYHMADWSLSLPACAARAISVVPTLSSCSSKVLRHSVLFTLHSFSRPSAPLDSNCRAGAMNGVKVCEDTPKAPEAQTSAQHKVRALKEL